MNTITITVGTLAMVAGLGLGVSLTTVVKTRNVEAEMISALRTFDEERRRRDAEELEAADQQRREQTQRLMDQAMKGWGQYKGDQK